MPPEWNTWLHTEVMILVSVFFGILAAILLGLAGKVIENHLQPQLESAKRRPLPWVLGLVGGALVFLVLQAVFNPQGATDTGEDGQAAPATSATASTGPPQSTPSPEPPAPPRTTQATGEKVVYMNADLGTPYSLGKDRGIACPESIGVFCLAYDVTVENEFRSTPGGCYLSWEFFRTGDPQPVDSGRVLYCDGSLFVGREGSVLPPGNYELVLRVELDDGSVTTKRQPISLEL
jgi:uncharacterized membrane protein YeaQ/YmgE (transglycosylase-associated protein family)